MQDFMLIAGSYPSQGFREKSGQGKNKGGQLLPGMEETAELYGAQPHRPVSLLSLLPQFCYNPPTI
jgi:hypothetical protein